MTLLRVVLLLLAVAAVAVHADVPKTIVVDFAVLGGGGAGCVNARVLSESGQYEVALLEQGGNYDPSLALDLGSGTLHWDQPDEVKVQSTVQPFTYGREPHFRTKERLAGGTAVWGSVSMRASKSYFDQRMPAEYNWEKMLPRMKENERHFCCFLPENMTGISAADCEAWHGCTGKMGVAMKVVGEIPPSMHAVRAAAGTVIGISNDHNNPNQRRGAALEQNFIELSDPANVASPRFKGSTAYGWIPQSYIDSHPNLHVITESRVLRLLFSASDSSKVIGAEYLHNGTVLKKVLVRRAAVLSMGVIKTPGFLHSQGFGPLDLLQRIRVPVVRGINDAIGQNLSCQLGALVGYQLNDTTFPYGASNAPTNFDFFVKSPYTTLDADIQLSVGGGGYAETIDYDVAGLPLRFTTGYISALERGDFGLLLSRLKYVGFNIQMVDPSTTGSVNATSPNSLHHPVVDFGWTDQALFSNNDFNKLQYALDSIRAIMNSEPFRSQYQPVELFPGDYYKADVARDYGLTDPVAIQRKADEYFFRYQITNMYHITGSVRLGQAIDMNGNVKGAQRLKVCDNSVLPQPDGNPTTTMMAVCSEMMHRVLAEGIPAQTDALINEAFA